MRDALASKCFLVVAIISVALVCGGCQQSSVGEAGTARAAPLMAEPAGSVATAGPSRTYAPPVVGDAPEPVSQSDVIGWAVRGVTDDVIVDRIDHARATFHLSASEEMRLRDAGVSDQVVMAMKATVWN